MKYCQKCGNEIMEEAVICPKCGCATGYKAPVNDEKDYLSELSKKVKINAIIWMIIAAVQILLAITVNWLLLIVAFLNIVVSIGDIKYSNNVLNNPVGIVKKYEPIVGPIIVLVYNLIFGGVIGIAGSIYYLVGIRSFVLNNKETFNSYESQDIK